MKGILKKSAIGLLLTSSLLSCPVCYYNKQPKNLDSNEKIDIVLPNSKDMYADLLEIKKYKKSLPNDKKEVKIKSKRPKINFEEIKEI